MKIIIEKHDLFENNKDIARALKAYAKFLENDKHYKLNTTYKHDRWSCKECLK